MIVILILLSGFIFVLLFLYVMIVLDYKSHIKEKQTISLREYLHIYAMAPEKWRFRDGAYIHLEYFEDCSSPISGWTDIYMESYIDHLKLLKIANTNKKYKLNHKLAKERANLLKMWQKDINDYHDKYIKELKQLGEI